MLKNFFSVLRLGPVTCIRMDDQMGVPIDKPRSRRMHTRVCSHPRISKLVSRIGLRNSWPARRDGGIRAALAELREASPSLTST